MAKIKMAFKMMTTMPKANMLGAMTMMAVNHVGLYKAYQETKAQQQQQFQK